MVSEFASISSSGGGGGGTSGGMATVEPWMRTEAQQTNQSGPLGN